MYAIFRKGMILDANDEWQNYVSGDSELFFATEEEAEEYGKANLFGSEKPFIVRRV